MICRMSTAGSTDMDVVRASLGSILFVLINYIQKKGKEEIPYFGGKILRNYEVEEMERSVASVNYNIKYKNIMSI